MIGQKEKALSYKEYCEKLRDVASRLKDCQHELADAEQEAGKLERGGTDISPLKELREKAITAQSALKPFAEEAEALSSLKDSTRKDLFQIQQDATEAWKNFTEDKMKPDKLNKKVNSLLKRLKKVPNQINESNTEQSENAELYAQLIENTENELTEWQAYIAFKKIWNIAKSESEKYQSIRKSLIQMQEKMKKAWKNLCQAQTVPNDLKESIKTLNTQLSEQMNQPLTNDTEQPENADLYAQLIENTENELRNLAESPNQLFIPLPERLKQYESALEKAQSVLHDFQDELSKLNDEKSEEILKKGLCVSLQEPPQTPFSAVMQYLNKLLSDYKAVLGVLLTIGTIFISAAMYLYKKGYLSYFIIGAEWNDFADKSVFYLLALPFCIFIIAAALCSILIAPYCIAKSRILKTIYLLLITIGGSIGIALLIGHSAWFCLIFVIELLLCCIALTIGDKSHAVQADHSKYERNVLIIFWFVSLFFMALPIFLEQHSVISQDTCNFLGVISVLAFLFITVEIIFYFIIKAIFFKSAQPAQSNSSSDSTEKKINCFFICVVIAIAGYIIYGIGQTVAELDKSFPIIYMSEQQESQPPDADTIREIRELVTVTTTASGTTAPAQANGSTTTTTPAPPTTTASETTTASDVPDSAVVYVVLAENKDSYLAAMGKIEGDGAGGILRIDPDCRTVLEKGKQTTVTLTFREVTKDYVYAKEVAP